MIVFEGIDGTGKSTHCKLLLEYLQARGFSVISLSEPTRGAWGKKIRDLLVKGREGVSSEEELSWFINDRKENVERNILPALAQNKVVLMDRYYYSTAAYQGALGLDREKILRENQRFAPLPDRVFIFAAPLETCLERIKTQRVSGPDSFERFDYLEKVQRIFDSFVGSRFRRIDSSAPREAVHAQIRKEVEALLPKVDP